MAVPNAFAVSGVTTLCSSLPGGDTAGGIYATGGGALVEGYGTGNLYFCGGNNSKLIASPPSGGSGSEYYGMGAVQTSGFGLVLALISYHLQGFWLCEFASSSDCDIQSTFISLPSTFCSSEPITHACHPTGAALDSSLNLYYLDNLNVKLVECMRSGGYHTCVNLAASSFLSGAPAGLVLVGTTLYIADEGSSCAATTHVWKGTKTSLSIIGTFHEDLEGIGVSNKNPSKTLHVYVGFSGVCTTSAERVIDITDMKSLPTPFTSSGYILAIDSSLQFSSFSPGAIYQTTDTS